MRRVLLAALVPLLSCRPDAGFGKSETSCAVDGALVIVETHAHTLLL